MDPEEKPPEVDSLIGSHVGEYRVERKLGEGGMASVYAAVHPLIGKRAALKVMAPMLSVDANAVVRFVQEARAVNQIGHPNIVDVFSFGRLPDGRCYFLMEQLEGESLHELLAHRRLSLGEVIDIVDQIADALEATHAKGIIHRDIKPANIFLVERYGRPDQVKLLDFGVAKLHACGEHTSVRTRTGLVVGTPEYLSPEQARGREVDACTDVYALGATLFEMVLGELPFHADNAMDMVRLHMTEPPPKPSSIWPAIPPPLESLILSMLSKHPSGRPSLVEVRRRLAALRGVPAPSLPPRRSRRKKIDSRRVQMLAGGVALALGLVVLGWSSFHVEPSAVPELVLPRSARIEPVVIHGVPDRLAPTAAPSTPHKDPPPRVSRKRARSSAQHVPGDELLDPFSSR